MNLDRLSLDKSNNNSVNFCLATNMISVGVDVPRLSAMLINSLPKSVSEYIQATSRVGRGSNPGLVMVLFSPNRMRDKSYYEEFKRFHVEQGRMVESVTITPFSSRSLERVLPTVLFAMIRMSKQSEQLEKPKTLSDTKIKELSDFIVERCNVIDSKQVSNLEQFLQHFFDKWNFETDNKVYGSFNGRALPGVVVNCLATQLHEHSEKAEINRPFVIMSSLRNVDISEGVKVYNNA
jgi:superfamily II DNA/RNA helicase